MGKIYVEIQRGSGDPPCPFLGAPMVAYLKKLLLFVVANLSLFHCTAFYCSDPVRPPRPRCGERTAWGGAQFTASVPRDNPSDATDTTSGRVVMLTGEVARM